MKVDIIDVTNLNFAAIPRPIYVPVDKWALLDSCYSRSVERWMGVADGELACLWGLIPPTFLSDTAYLWLYHTDLVEKYKFRFIRHSQVQMQRMLQHYPNIVGDCQVANTTGRKWLEWLGAKFSPPDPCGLAPFHIRASNG